MMIFHSLSAPKTVSLFNRCVNRNLFLFYPQEGNRIFFRVSYVRILFSDVSYELIGGLLVIYGY